MHHNVGKSGRVFVLLSWSALISCWYKCLWWICSSTSRRARTKDRYSPTNGTTISKKRAWTQFIRLCFNFTTSHLYRESFVLPIETSRRHLNRQYSQVSTLQVLCRIVYYAYILIDCVLQLRCQRFMFRTSTQADSETRDWLMLLTVGVAYERFSRKLILNNIREVHKHCVTTLREKRS